MVKAKKKKKTVWTNAMENSECIGKETELGGLFNIRKVCPCCEKPNLWFQIIDASPVTNLFCVVCKACGKIGKTTNWSWPEAVVLWNIALLEAFRAGEKGNDAPE